MHSIDIGIIIAYMVITLIGGLILSRRASKNIDSYFLGEKNVPWYLLGIAGAATMFDITGTMWSVTMLFIYGLKSVWLPWLWPTFNTVFMAVYLATWIRRSNVLTGSEWMRTRFGDKRGGELAEISVAMFALAGTIAFVAYAYAGVGKFFAIFLPWDLSPHTYAVIIMSVTAVYTVCGGMYSVILNDVFQYAIMTVCCGVVAWIALDRVAPEALAAVIPDGWNDLFFGWNLNIDWSQLIPHVNTVIGEHGYSPWGFFFMMMVIKGIMNSLAGPNPDYNMQRILAARNSKEASVQLGLTSVFIFVPRFFMIAGITMLALVFFSDTLKTMGSSVDFEQILPYVINNFIPTGLMGLLLAGLLAAFMSTVSSMLNAGAAYAVNDIYKRYMNPDASPKKYVFAGYFCTILLVVIGMLLGYVTPSIERILQWIVAGLYGGYTAPNILKWYWWRLNGIGYFVGMVIGMCVAIILPIIAPHLPPLYGFPFILVLSLVGCIVTSCLTRPQDEKILISFYRTVRPWGFWGPIHEKVVAADPNFVKNTKFRRDMVNIVAGTAWQLKLTLIPVFLMIRAYRSMWITVAVLIITSVFLKKNWYDKLETN